MTDARRALHRSGSRMMAAALAIAVAGALAVGPPAHAADENRLNAGVGYPEWAGSEDPVPDLPVPPTVGNQMRAIFDADVAAGAGSDTDHDFWIDDMLARYGTAGGFGDTNNWLFTRGRAAYMYTHQPGTVGFGGRAAYWHELGVASAYTVTANVDGSAVSLTEDTSLRKQTPSYWTSTFANDDAGLRLVQTKFITHNNVAVTNLELTSTDGAAKTVSLRATSPLATTPDGDELTGTRTTRNNITTLYPRFSGDGFAPDGGALTRTLEVPAEGSAGTKVQLGYVTTEIPESRTEYDAVRAATPDEAYTTHVTAYNRWWADNVPYLDTPEDNIDKTLFYRWWLMRFNFLDADVPGNDFQFPTSMEGVLGYNNAIVLTVGMFIDDLKYFRDPIYSYGPWVSAGETARSHKMEDNPGSPSNWSNSYTQYISEAGWRSYQLHGGPGAIAGNLAVYAQNDVKGLLDAYDSNDNNLIEYDWGAMTGNDADAVSFDWAREHGHVNMDRAENAYLYSNALASAEAYAAVGDDAKAQEMRDFADMIKTAVMDTLWDADDDLIKHRQAGGDRLLVDWKEINNYYPFSVGLVPKPGDADYDDDYVEALRLWKYYDEYPIFPFYTANQVDADERGGGGSNNFSVINSTVTFRMLSSVLRDYPNDYVGADYYKKLLYWNAWAHYINGDNRLPDQNEFWNTGSANTEWGDEQGIGYRSWIHHTILGTTNFTMIEDAMGLRPRSDDKLELDPIDIDWPHFMANNIRLRDKDLTIVWDAPGDGERPYGEDIPEGYSAFLDGALAFTVDSLGRVVYDPATGTIEESDDHVTVTAVNATSLQAPNEVRFDDDARVVDLFAKAGADIATATTGTPNLAEGAQVNATYTAAASYSSLEAAVDGTTINEPFWGTVGSPNARDAIEIDLGGQETFDDVRVYFYRTSSSDSPQGGRLAGTRQGYAAPSMYSVEYLDGDEWRPVDSQAKSPVYPRANYNHVQFPAVSASKVRVTVTHAPGFRTGVKEVQVFNTGVEAPDVSNAPPSVSARTDAGYAQAGSARLIGTVLDDGLPAGELSSTWTVVDAPDGATALFDNPNQATTVVRFSHTGTYRLRLTATDGALEQSADLVVEGTSAGEGVTNVAPAATPTASYTASWNDVNAVNDGEGQNSGGPQTELWGTWSGSRPATQWLQYTWDSQVRISGSEIMFWTDAAAGSGNGVAVPESWVMQYRDASGEWVDVPNADEYGTARTGTNTTTFDAVTTTALRATFNASPNAAGTSYSAIGVAEWKIFADSPTSLEDLHIRTDVGVVPDLPDEIIAIYSDGTRVPTDVAWPTITEDQVAADGGFTVQGIVEGTPLMASATIWVRSSPPGQINTIDTVEVYTDVGVAPQLPERVTVQYNDGSREMLPVAWEDADPADYADDNTFVVDGTVEGAGTTAATAMVTVGDGGEGAPDTIKPVASITLDPDLPVGGWTADDVTVSVAATDNRDGDLSLEIAVDDGAWGTYTDPVVVSGEGQHTVRARATDAAGNVSDVVEATFGIDTTPPEVTAALEDDQHRIAIEASDAGSGVASVEYRLGDETEWSTYSGPVAIWPEAVTVHLRATDAVGNVSDESSVDIPAVEGPINLGPLATVSASYTAPWNNIDAVNDGQVPDGGGNGTFWGTWSGDRPASQWLRYDWDRPVVVDEVQIQFAADSPQGTGNGIAEPDSWSLQYLDAAGIWVDVPDVADPPTSTTELNVAAFDPITTTALRVTIKADSDGTDHSAVGVTEWVVMGVPWSAPDFADVGEDHPFYEAIRWLAAERLVDGEVVGDEVLFHPDDATTREALAVVLHRYAGQGWVPEEGTQTFADVGPDHASYVAVEWLAAQGLAEADKHGRFKPTAPVKRGDMALWLHRLAGSPQVDDGRSFSDVPAGSELADAVAWVVEAEVMDPARSDRFGVNPAVSRGEMASHLLGYDTHQTD